MGPGGGAGKGGRAGWPGCQRGGARELPSTHVLPLRPARGPEAPGPPTPAWEEPASGGGQPSLPRTPATSEMGILGLVGWWARDAERIGPLPLCWLDATVSTPTPHLGLAAEDDGRAF